MATWLSIPGGEAIVDPGASQDLIGLAAFEKLKARLAEVNLKPITLDEAPSDASGIGGKAKPLFVALTPCCLGGYPGVVKLTVLEEDVPHLLSVGLLEMAKSVIDTGENMIFFKAFGTESSLRRLNTGHRLLDVASWEGGEFPVPEQIANDYGLLPGSFNLTRAQSEYDGCCGRGMGKGGTGIRQYLQPILNKGVAGDHCFDDGFYNLVSVCSNSGFSSEFPTNSKYRFCNVFVKCGVHFVLIQEDMERHKGPLGRDLHDTFETVISIFTISPIRVSLPFNILTVVRCCDSLELESGGLGRKSHSFLEDSVSESVEPFHLSEHARSFPRSVCLDQKNPPVCSCESLVPDESGRRHLEGTQRSSHHVRACVRVRQEPLVSHGSSAAEQQGKDGELAAAGGRMGSGQQIDASGRLSSSCGQDRSRGEPIWEVDKVHSVQEQADLRGLQRSESSHQRQEDQAWANLCGSAQGAARCEDQEQEQGIGGPGVHGHFESGVVRGIGEAGWIPGEWHSTGSEPTGSGSSTDAAGNAGIDEHTVQQLTTDACATFDGALRDEFRRGDGEPQPDRLGSAALSLASLGGRDRVSPSFVTGNSKHWFARPLCRKSMSKHPTLFENQFVWQDVVGDTWLVWYDASLSDNLCFSDDVDDFEFQLTRKQKRSLRQTLEESFLTEDFFIKNSNRHFVGSLHDQVEPNAASRQQEQQGEDLRTSTNNEEQGEDLKTSRNFQEQGEDLRTSRSQQEAERSQLTSMIHQEAEGPYQFAAISGDPMIREALARSVHGATQCLVVCELFSPARVGIKAVKRGLDTTSPSAFDRLGRLGVL